MPNYFVFRVTFRFETPWFLPDVSYTRRVRAAASSSPRERAAATSPLLQAQRPRHGSHAPMRVQRLDSGRGRRADRALLGQRAGRRDRGLAGRVAAGSARRHGGDRLLGDARRRARHRGRRTPIFGVAGLRRRDARAHRPGTLLVGLTMRQTAAHRRTVGDCRGADSATRISTELPLVLGQRHAVARAGRSEEAPAQRAHAVHRRAGQPARRTPRSSRTTPPTRAARCAGPTSPGSTSRTEPRGTLPAGLRSRLPLRGPRDDRAGAHPGHSPASCGRRRARARPRAVVGAFAPANGAGRDGHRDRGPGGGRRTGRGRRAPQGAAGRRRVRRGRHRGRPPPRQHAVPRPFVEVTIDPGVPSATVRRARRGPGARAARQQRAGARSSSTRWSA